jgi:hypothetical protein
MLASNNADIAGLQLASKAHTIATIAQRIVLQRIVLAALSQHRCVTWLQPYKASLLNMRQ